MSQPLPAVILAGGLSRRMGGGDKALLPLAGRPVLARVIERLGPRPVAINANGDPARFEGFGLPLLPDPVAGHPGPLAGILAAMIWARARGAAQVLTVACDLPFLPTDLAERLGTGPAIAHSGGRDHPTAGLWPVTLAEGLRAQLDGGGRRVMDWVATTGARRVAFDGDPDPFLNLNTPEDLLRAEAILRDRQP